MAAGSSSEPQEGPPSFFKVIRNPSAPHLSLPNAFVRRYLHKIPKTPKIVTVTGEHSWRMEFVKIGEDYCFAHGWEKLANDVQFSVRDIVIFWLIDPLTFQVSFLGANGCEKDLPFNKTNFADDDGKDGGCHDDEVMTDMDLCFEKLFSLKTNRYHMSLPIGFVKAAGLEHEKSIKLKDHKGKMWTMGILAERYAKTKYSMSAGWARFRRHYKLSDDDELTFTFNKKECVLILTQLTKKSTEPETPMEEVIRNRYGVGNVKITDDWPPVEKHCNASGKVKIEYESGPETEVVNNRKRERSRLESFANVKIEDGSVPDTVAGNGKTGMPPPPEKPSRGGPGGGVEVRAEQEKDRVFTSKHVIYF